MSAEPDRPPRARRWFAWPLVALGVILLIVVLLVALRPGAYRDAAPADTVAAATPDVRLRVSRAQPLTGTNLVEIDIGTGGYGGGSFSSSGSRPETRNILLLDRASGAARRLLPDNGRVIAQAWFLPAEADYVAPSTDMGTVSDAERAPPAYFALLVARAADDNRFDLLVGSLAGPEQGFVMAGLDGVDALWMQSPTRIGLIVRERGLLFYRIVDIPALRVVQQRRVEL